MEKSLTEFRLRPVDELGPEEGNRLVNVVVEAPIDHPLTYCVPAAFSGQVQPGSQVRVPLGRRTCVGYVVSAVASFAPEVRTPREILAVLDGDPVLSPQLLDLTRWMANYYCVSWGEVLKSAVPKGLKRPPKPPEAEVSRSLPANNSLSRLTLMPSQEQAVARVMERLSRREFHTFLLHGITGSGKTEVYLRVIEEGLAQGRGAIVLVPEISMTPQLLERFSARFGPRIAVLHSRLGAGERLRQWRKIRSGECPVAIGARSALFAPVENPGIVIVDEEHDPSYKQEESPRYHGRDTALMRAKLAGAVAILGSATPSLESFYNAERGRYTYLSLPERVEDRSLPRIRIIDLRRRTAAEDSVLSLPLRAEIASRLERREQTLLFLNRRGFSTYVLCLECGHALLCPNCEVTLVYHAQRALLRCHYCGFSRRAPERCPACQGIRLSYRGLGTQRLEREVGRLFPGARLARLDRDATEKKGEVSRILSRLAAGEIDILVGTQMITKGHDYPRITLVGVVSADSALHVPDFRAGEHAFQILTQVAGRAGRGDVAGEVIIQTYHPENHSVVCAANHDYEQFCRRELSLRRRLFYPPFSRITLLRLEGQNPGRVEGTARRLGDALRRAGSRDNGVEVLGPAPGSVPRVRNRFRWHLILRGERAQGIREVLRGVLASFPEKLGGAVRLIVDVDPVNFL